MSAGEIAGGAFGAIASIAVGWLGWLGVRRQQAGAREASKETNAQASQDRALAAWEKLLQPHIAEIARLTLALDERDQRDRERDAHDQRVDLELRHQRRRIVQLERENDSLLSMARIITRWAVRLRDQVVELGGNPGAEPDELETLQALGDAEHGRRPAVASDDEPADDRPDLTTT